MTNVIGWLNTPAEIIDQASCEAAQNRQKILTKPAGSLGQLEDVAISLAGMLKTPSPAIDNVHCSIFAADHGVAAEGVSAFPQVVTGEMIRNFARGGAAICVITNAVNANLEVINLGTVNEIEDLDGVTNCTIGSGTENFAKYPAMNEQQLSLALSVGRQAVERAKLANCQLFIGGELGIANTTSATALACALMGLSPEVLAGPGTGLDDEGIKHKINVISQSLALHKNNLITPINVLQHLGGFEIAALVGAYISCAQIGVPVLVDGFITSVAALTACRILPEVQHWLIFSHTSAEPGHRLILAEMQARPLLDLNMRLGEGSGAAIAVPLLQITCKLHNEMASFTEANISDKVP